jgi:prophage regulatory protein
MSNFIRLKNVRSMTGLSRSSIYAMMKAGEFPKNVLLGARAVGWIDSEVNDWIEGKVASRGNH